MKTNFEYQIGDFIVPEQIIPQPETLRKIASMVLMVAQDSNKLKGMVSPRTRTPALYWVDAKLGQNDEVGSNEYTLRSARYQYNHVVTEVDGIDPDAQIEKIRGTEGKGSLRYRQITEERLFADIWRGQVETYSFEWHNDRTVKSQRIVLEAPSVEEGEVEHMYDHLVAQYGEEALTDNDLKSQLELIAGTPTLRETQFVTRDDCARLLGTMRALRNQDAAEQRAA